MKLQQTLTWEFTLQATCKPSWQCWPIREPESPKWRDESWRAKRDFPLCAHFAFHKTRHNITELPEPAMSYVQMKLQSPRSGDCSLQDSFISTWHLLHSVLHLLFRSHNLHHPRYTAVFFFKQLSFQPLHIKYCLPFNCWWSLPAVVWLCSQNIIDRHPRQAYLNSLRLAWFAFLRCG